MARQKAAFQRWGVMANWDHCYLTLDGPYQATQLRLFQEMHSKVGHFLLTGGWDFLFTVGDFLFNGGRTSC